MRFCERNIYLQTSPPLPLQPLILNYPKKHSHAFFLDKFITTKAYLPKSDLDIAVTSLYVRKYYQSHSHNLKETYSNQYFILKQQQKIQIIKK